MKKVALITLHGMGVTPENYADGLSRDIAYRLGSDFDSLHIGAVYYKGILLENEKRIWERVGRRVRWDGLRQFLLFGFADAAGLETSKSLGHSVYSQAQVRLARELYIARKAMGHDGPIIVLAQSLGGQVASCYFWDAQAQSVGDDVQVGIWKGIRGFEVEIAGPNSLTEQDISFLRGKTIRHIVTTGCNIPIFVAARATKDILPIKPNDNFKWTNYYDKDDVLGWPLSDLSEQYKDIVTDVQVNAGGGILGWISSSWNPMSHLQYWRDDEILDPLADIIKSIIREA